MKYRIRKEGGFFYPEKSYWGFIWDTFETYDPDYWVKWRTYFNTETEARAAIQKDKEKIARWDAYDRRKEEDKRNRIYIQVD